MPGLVPGIHAGTFNASPKTTTPAAATENVEVLKPSCTVTTWIPGTRPGMTLKALCKFLKLAPMGGTPAVPGGVGRKEPLLISQSIYIDTDLCWVSTPSQGNLRPLGTRRATPSFSDCRRANSRYPNSR